LIVHWPKGISARGELRHDVGHVVDFLPTLLELGGGTFDPNGGKAESPALPGRSLVPAFAHDGATTRDYVFFNHEGNRALRIGDWKIVSAKIDADEWELYDLTKDRSEMNNLAAAQPERVREMSARWKQLNEQFARDAGSEDPEKKKPRPKRPGEAD
jgi:arylsulfatase